MGLLGARELIAIAAGFTILLLFPGKLRGIARRLGAFVGERKRAMREADDPVEVADVVSETVGEANQVRRTLRRSG